jgi:hypothetical protein
MGGWYPPHEPVFEPKPKPGGPVPDQPTPKEKDLLCHYFVLRQEISELEALIDDEKELDKAVVLLKVGCKLLKKRLRKIGFAGPLRNREMVSSWP